MTAQELKNSVLRRAFRGELVERRVEEGTGAELLKQIEAEKAALTKTGKLKKEKPLPTITEEEKPFEIPEHWTWVRLNEVGEIARGKSKHRPRNDKILYEGGTYPFIQTGDVARSNGSITKCNVYYNETGLAQSKMWPTGTLCLTIAANIADVGILEFDACFPDSVVGFNAFKPIRSNKYFLYLLMAYRTILDSLATQTAQKNINVETITSLWYPLPPLAEQARIVAKLEEIWPEIERYAAARDELEALNRRFPTDLRKAVLQSAIRGELVERRAEEGTGAELLRQIEAEKASLTKAGKLKKEKPLPPITEEEKPFEIPEHWTWVRLPFIANMCLGKMLDKQKNTGDLAPYLRNVNVRWGDFDLSDLLEMRFEDCSDDRFLIQKNDLVMCEGGEPGRCAIWTRDEPIHFQKALHRIRFYPPLLPNFYYYLCSLYTANGIFSQLFTGSTIKHLTGQSLEKICVPLPPLAEQARIVAKLEEILPLCDRLR